MIKGFDPFLFLNSIGIGLCIIYLIALAGKPTGNRLGNILTAVNYLSQIFMMTAFVMYYLNEKEFLPYMLLFSIPFGFLNGPLFWLMMKCFMLNKRKMELSDWLHFGQFFISGIAVKVLIIFVPDFFHYIDLSSPDSTITTTRIYFATYITLNWVFYYYRFVRDFLELKNLYNQKPSSVKKAKYRFSILVGINVGILLLIYAYGFIFDFSMNILYIITSAISIIFILDGVYVLQHPEMYDEEKDDRQKYLSPIIPSEKIDFYLKRLFVLMDEEKSYRDSELSLSVLAEKLGLTGHQLSELLNDKLKQNFNDFINSYRVEEAKKLLVDPKFADYKVFTIAMEVGFNTKATFNTAFKKFTAMTPTEFREKK